MTVLKSHRPTWTRRCRSILIACIPLGSAFLAAACAATNELGEMALAHVEAGTHSSLDNRSFLVIESADDFARWYRDLHAHRLPVPTAPRIDFRRHLVLAVSMGQRPTGGYGIRLSDAVLDGDTIKVTVLERHPDPVTAQITVVTNPYAIASIVRGEFGKVAFVGADGQVLAVRRIAPFGR